MRFIAIGDIHGCADELQDLLDQLNLTDPDHLIFLGDLINRGPNSRGVLDIVKSLKNASFIMGNHELRLLKFHASGDASKLKAYDKKTIEILSPSDWSFLSDMLPHLFLEEHNIIFVHGGFEPHKPWDQQAIDTISTIQVVDEQGRGHKRSKSPNSPYWFSLWQGPESVVYGHIPKLRIERTHLTLGIDTACVYGGFLTAYILPSKDIVQVPARKPYLHKEFA